MREYLEHWRTLECLDQSDDLPYGIWHLGGKKQSITVPWYELLTPSGLSETNGEGMNLHRWHDGLRIRVLAIYESTRLTVICS